MSLLETLQEKTAPLTAAIPGDNPAGPDPTFEPEFEAIKKEIDKLSSVEDKPNWGSVVTGSAALLKNKAKDFRIAIWLTVAHVQANNFAGFAEGLVTLRGLCTQYWDQMYPDVKRGRARANMITWFIDQNTAVLEKVDVNKRNGEAVKVSDDMLNEIDGVLSEKLGELYTGLGKLRGLMRDKVRQIPPDDPPPPDPSTVVVQETTNTATVAEVYYPEETTATTSDAGAAPAISGIGDVEPALAFHSTSLVSIGHVLRREDPKQAWAYKLLRVGLWLPFATTPYNEGNVTQMASPPPDPIANFDALAESSSWADLLEALETEIPNYPMWFDLHRRAAMALEKLGGEFRPARNALGRAVVGFVSSCPGLVELLYADGLPIFDPLTKEWYQTEAERQGAGSSSKADAATAAEEAELKGRFEEAKAMVFGGKIAEGLTMATQLAARGKDSRVRFRSRTAVGQMALDVGRPAIAKPMLEALFFEAEHHHLETWEPALCVPVYTSLLTAIRAARHPEDILTPEAMAKEATLFDRLCRLDPAAAIKLSGQPTPG